MPFFTDDDEEEILAPPVSIVDNGATAPVYEEQGTTKSFIVDIEGEPWEVGYYNQILSSSDSPVSLDINLDPTLQQYLHVVGFRLSVTEDIASNYNAEVGTTEVTGSGIIYPNTVIPHIGDMFIGRMDMGFNGLFTITSINRDTFYEKSAFRVEYRLFDQLDASLQENLTSKVVENKYFDKYRLLAGNNPMVSYAVANKEVGYKQAMVNMLDVLYQNFWSDRLETFIFAHNDSSGIYDPWAVNFFNQIMSRKKLNNYSLPKEYSIGEFDIVKKPTLWRAILNANTHGLEYLYPREYNLVSAKGLGTPFILNSIVHTNIQYVPMPENFSPGFTVDTDRDAYVLTHAFYANDVENMSLLEKAVFTVADKKVVTDGVIDTLLNEVKSKENGELFYNVILLIAILNIRLTEV